MDPFIRVSLASCLVHKYLKIETMGSEVAVTIEASPIMHGFDSYIFTLRVRRNSSRTLQEHAEYVWARSLAGDPPATLFTREQLRLVAHGDRDLAGRPPAFDIGFGAPPSMDGISALQGDRLTGLLSRADIGVIDDVCVAAGIDADAMVGSIHPRMWPVHGLVLERLRGSVDGTRIACASIDSDKIRSVAADCIRGCVPATVIPKHAIRDHHVCARGISADVLNAPAGAPNMAAGDLSGRLTAAQLPIEARFRVGDTGTELNVDIARGEFGRFAPASVDAARFGTGSVPACKLVGHVRGSDLRHSSLDLHEKIRMDGATVDAGIIADDGTMTLHSGATHRLGCSELRSEALGASSDMFCSDTMVTNAFSEAVDVVAVNAHVCMVGHVETVSARDARLYSSSVSSLQTIRAVCTSLKDARSISSTRLKTQSLLANATTNAGSVVAGEMRVASSMTAGELESAFVYARLMDAPRSNTRCLCADEALQSSEVVCDEDMTVAQIQCYGPSCVSAQASAVSVTAPTLQTHQSRSAQMSSYKISSATCTASSLTSRDGIGVADVVDIANGLRASTTHVHENLSGATCTARCMSSRYIRSGKARSKSVQCKSVGASRCKAQRTQLQTGTFSTLQALSTTVEGNCSVAGGTLPTTKLSCRTLSVKDTATVPDARMDKVCIEYVGADSVVVPCARLHRGAKFESMCAHGIHASELDVLGNIRAHRCSVASKLACRNIDVNYFAATQRLLDLSKTATYLAELFD